MPSGHDSQKKTDNAAESISAERAEHIEEEAPSAAGEPVEEAPDGSASESAESAEEERKAPVEAKRTARRTGESRTRAARDAVERILSPDDAREPVAAPPFIAHRNARESKRVSSDGNIFYLSGEALERPIEPPASVRRRSMAILAAAIVLGIAFLAFYFDSIINGPAREQALLEERIEQEVDLNLPSLPALIPLDDAAILATLQQSGDVLYERTPVGSTEPFDVIKLPPDVSLADAAALYLKGTASLSASEAALLLNGSWDLNIDREQGINMVVRYADFSSGNLERAISNAARSQGFDTAAAGVESGEDTSGNTFMSGAMEIAGASYTWRVSALPLSEVYSQAGLPEDAAYVGIRIYS